MYVQFVPSAVFTAYRDGARGRVVGAAVEVGVVLSAGGAATEGD